MRRAIGSSALALAAMAFLFVLPAARAADAPVETISEAVHEHEEDEQIVVAMGITTFVLLLCTATLGLLTHLGRRKLFKFHVTFAILTALSAATHGTLVLILL